MMKRPVPLFALLLALLLIPPAASAGGPTLLFDSGSVAAGTQIQTPVLDLGGFGGYQALQLYVDNTTGTALRSLTLESCLDSSCSTVIDSVLLRRIAYGGIPTGGAYASGRARGYVGPNPPGGSSVVSLLADCTSPAATGQYCPPGATSATADDFVVTEDCDEVLFEEQPIGGTPTASNFTVMSLPDDPAVAASTITNPSSGTAVQSVRVSVGPAATATAVGQYLASVPGPVPRRMRAFINSIGVGIQSRFWIWCKGRPPGTFSVQMLVPARARLTLASGGSGAARLTVYGN